MRLTFVLAAAGLVAWPLLALAQQGGPRLDSPGEIAVWSTVITQKQDYCRRQARVLKVPVWKRHRFIRNCMKQ
jgi:hypothetical protein